MLPASIFMPAAMAAAAADEALRSRRPAPLRHLWRGLVAALLAASVACTDWDAPTAIDVPAHLMPLQ